MQKLSDKKLVAKLVENFAYPVLLSYVVDDKGDALVQYNIHPQMDDDHCLDLQLMNSEQNAMLTLDDVRALGKKLIDWANTAENIIHRYELQTDDK